jgi:hypothetical protein
MTTPTATFESLVDDLLHLLDREHDILQLRHEQMRALYDVILSNDDGRMETLLREMTRAQQDQAALDEELDTLRSVLARLLELPTEELRLGLLVQRLSGERRDALARKHNAIIEQARLLKVQHLDTALVLTEASRLNRMLLEGLLPQAGEVRTYGSQGKHGWRDNTGLVDAEM